MVKSRHFIATPPGATIKEQLADRGMTQKELAARMDMTEKHISKLINGDVTLTPDVAVRLEMVLGIPAQFWNNLEAIYREKLIKAEEENKMDADIELVKKLPYNEMARNGWVPETQNNTEKVIYARKFFEVINLGLLQDDLIPAVACRRLAVTEKADFALIAWAQKAKLDARGIETKSVNIDRLKTVIPEIRAMTIMDPNDFCPKLIDTLAHCGIALVFLPHIKGSFLHGATFYDSGKIVVGLTVRGKDADKFWFSLFHELGHVLKGHVGKLDGTTAEDEHEADAYAQETLIPAEILQPFVDRGDYSKKAVVQFANQHEIAPGIVVGRLQTDNYIQFSWLNDLKTQYVIS